MFASNAVTNKLPRIKEFYHGKSIFLTGSTGFVGSVLLEILLRCCPGIESIYTLIRIKKYVQPKERKEEIFNKKIFEKLKNETPELLEKVRVISGDASLPNLGMSEDDTNLLLGEVSIVFHCASVINFGKPLEFLLKNNVLSLSSVIELCRKMRKFEVLVYTSTAYSNCNHLNFPIKEEVYRLPFHASTFLDALKKEDNEKLQELIAHCKPDWPNWYCFSKCLAENVITDTASDLPIAIIRPSIVVGSWKHPIPGYVQENSGIMAISLAIGKGFIKVLNADPNSKLNLVPADIVANAHCLAAWIIGTKRSASPLVLNCTATENLHVEFGKYIETLTQLFREFPLPRSFQNHTHSIIIPNKYLYYIMEAYYHYLPAIVMDVWLKILGKKSRLYPMNRFFGILESRFYYFWFNTFEFERNNLECIDKLIHPEDKQDLTLDFKDATILGILLSLPQGSPFYDWKKDKKSQSERQRIKHKRHMQITFIQVMFLLTCCQSIFWLLFCIFF